MKNLYTSLATAATLLLVFAQPGRAQPMAAPAPAYTGPRFPGGPDSLRALVYRSTLRVSPSLRGLAVVQFELKDGREPINFRLLTPPEPAASALKTAPRPALEYLQAQMPAWIPAEPDPDARPDNNPRVRLALHFGLPLRAQPHNYPDQEPVFPDFAALLRAQRNVYFERNMASPAMLARLASPDKGLGSFLQMQVRYPPLALRQQQQGVVHLYFEVAENGAIEQTQIVGTVSDVLDAEVLRVARQLPAATSPARLNGQPVRIYYLIPMTFKIQ